MNRLAYDRVFFTVIDIEVQNETHQSQDRLRFAVMPRIGEGIRLREPNGFWASYDILDLWYQKAEYGDVWVPYIHVRITPGEMESGDDDEKKDRPAEIVHMFSRDMEEQEQQPFTI